MQNNVNSNEHINEDLKEKVLDRLGFSCEPSINYENLTLIYQNWCQKIPFDNILKRIHANSNIKGPLPGNSATEFFNSWLATGAGGTCWAGNGALYSLLKKLGFSVNRGISTMIPPTENSIQTQIPKHGTVVVNLDKVSFIVDATMMHGKPISLETQSIDNPVFGVSVSKIDENWHIKWRPLGRPFSNCRVEKLNVSEDIFSNQHEISRNLSRFNQSIIFRIGRLNGIEGIVYGNKVVRFADGSETMIQIDSEATRKILIEEFGISEELAYKIPDSELIK